VAEKIVLPKAFTKAWFSYIWDYYKYHILGVLAAVVVGIYTVVQIVTAVKYDLNINFIAKDIMTVEAGEKVVAACKNVCDDLDSNGEVNISFTQHNFTDEAMQDQELHTTLMNKMMSYFAADDELLYIVDDYMLTRILSLSQTEGIFIPVSEWANTGVEEKNMYAASLKNSTVLENAMVDTSDMYLLVRMNYNENSEKLELKEENAIKIANFLIK